MTHKRHRMVTVYCKVCGNEFKSPKYDAMYCTDACKQKAYRERRSKNGNEKKQPKRKSLDYTLQLKTCPHCGTRFRFTRSDAKYCSDSCRVVANRNKQRRTISKLTRETGYKEFDLYQIVGNEGWKSLYDKLESMGFFYSDIRELWLHAASGELAKLL